MKVEKDFEELLKLLNKHKVKYCIVGSYAVAFHSKPRYTKDIDILIQPELDNAKKIVNALNEFGFESLKLTENDFIKKNYIIQLGFEPLRIDILTSITDLPFEEIWKGKKIGYYGKNKAIFLGLNELIKSKKISNRTQDKADLEILLNKKNSKRK
jgi:predicted nucleotidyltransferase